MILNKFKKMYDYLSSIVFEGNIITDTIVFMILFATVVVFLIGIVLGFVFGVCW